MERAMSLPFEHAKSTNCLLWHGPLSSDGQPVWYHRGKQRVLSRDAFGETFGWLALASRLRRVCATPLCISPWHHIVGNPRRVAVELGYCLDDVRGIAALLRARQQREPEDWI